MKTRGEVVSIAGVKMLESDGIKIQMACRHNDLPANGACGACYAAVTLALAEIRETMGTGNSPAVDKILDTLAAILAGQKEKTK